MILVAVLLEEPHILVPWPWLAGGITAVLAAMTAAIRQLYKNEIERHNKELERRDAVLDRVINTHEQGFNQMSNAIREGQKDVVSSYERVVDQLTALTRERDRQRDHG